MAVRSGFFNSINGDRIYSATHWAEYFATFIGNGVFPNPSSNLQIASNNNMTISVKAGKGWINGYILINDSDYLLDITPADGALNRIDRIIMRYDTVDREIRLEVKQGTFATNPTAPVLQRDADAFELALADIRVNAGAISISQANITDTRLNGDLCGIVHGVVDQVDTTTLFNQYQSWIAQEKLRFENDVDGWMANEQDDFETWEQQQKNDFDMWFANIQDILDGNVAANLQNQITQLQADLGNIDAPSTQEFESLQSDFSEHQAENASTSKKGHVQLSTSTSSTSTTLAATPSAVRLAMNRANEAFTSASNGKTLVGNAITGVDDSVVIPTDPTFQELADGIGNISTGLVSSPLYAGTDEIYTDNSLVNRPSSASGKDDIFHKAKEIRVGFSGSIRVKFDIGITQTTYSGLGQIFINNEPVGIERRGYTDYRTYLEDFTVQEGDLVQLFIRRDSTYGNYQARTRLFTVSVDLSESPIITKVV